MVSTKNILELMSDKLYMIFEGYLHPQKAPQMPTLEERLKLVKMLEDHMESDFDTITIFQTKNCSTSFPLWNYLLLIYHVPFKLIRDTNRRREDINIRIIGFNKFEELNEYIVNSDKFSGFYIYVKERNIYTEIKPHFCVIRKDSTFFYTDINGFTCPYPEQEDSFERPDDHRFQIELPDICEAQLEEQVICFYADSFDTIYDKLQMLIPLFYDAMFMDATKNGTLYYNNKDYLFKLHYSPSVCFAALYDEQLRIYSKMNHGFKSGDNA